jgi:UDP-2-acetamido-2-deoxy-ribo-hexuluronate aminotransferase
MSEEKIVMFDPRRHYRENQILYDQYFHKVLEHGKFIMGPEMKQLEDKLSGYVESKYALAVSSGTDALLIALMALDVGLGDEVVTVPFTWISTAEVICLLKAKPVFCDVDSKTFNMDANSLKNALTEKTKVVIPVSMFGQMYDVESVKKVVGEAEEKFGTKIFIVEDAAQSFGSRSKFGKSCNVSDIGCTSFFPSKPLGCFGDGGMCFTNDGTIYLNMKKIRTHGCIERFQYERVGINGRLDTLQAAILLAKFSDLDYCLKKRYLHAKEYSKELKKLPLIIPEVANYNSRHVYAQYTLILNSKEERDELMNFLLERNIDCGIFYKVCLHLVPAITQEYKKGDFPNSEFLSEQVLSIPCYPELEKEERTKVIECIRLFFSDRYSSDLKQCE